MGWLEFVRTVLEFAMLLWKSQLKTPEQKKLEAVSIIIKDADEDLSKFQKALASNDALQLSSSFEQLRLRIISATGGSGTK